jgi:exopolysaccharide biosynthesis polyprenyl glycosylphosphotransferase
LRFGPEELGPYIFDHLDGCFILFGSVLVANYLAGNYRLQYTFSRFNLVVTWFFSLVFAMLILSLTSYAWFKYLLGRGVLFLSLASYGAISLFLKMFVYRTLFRSGLFFCRTVIVGTGERAKNLRRMLEHEWVLPAHKVVAYIRLVNPDTPEVERYTMADDVAVVNSTGDTFESLVHSLGVDLIIVGLEDTEEAARFVLGLRRLRFESVEVLTALGVAEVYGGRTSLELINEEFLLEISMESGLPTIAPFKRLMDVLVASVSCVAFSPIAILVALFTKLTDLHHPVLYSQMRVGRFGRTFRIYKFRTMREGAEKETGPVWASDSDERVTRLGRILRRFRLDEIPQFVNIIRGDMSLVGPRPERPELVAELEKTVPFYRERENVMPGLTGWAQIRYGYGNTTEDAARKLEYDLYYMKHLSFALDLQILLSTLQIVLFGAEKGE